VESLKDFIASHAEKLRNEESQAADKRSEWVAAVDRLNQQITAWLTSADPDHVILEVRDTPCQRREEGIGTYIARGLIITAGRRELRLEPIARNVAGPLSSTGIIHVSRAYGRVDLTDGLQKYMIFRVEKVPDDRWNIIEQDGFRMRAFDQAAFEEAFKALLECLTSMMPGPGMSQPEISSSCWVESARNIGMGCPGTAPSAKTTS
jgi:hypothetical protein